MGVAPEQDGQKTGKQKKETEKARGEAYVAEQEVRGPKTSKKKKTKQEFARETEEDVRKKETMEVKLDDADQAARKIQDAFLKTSCSESAVKAKGGKQVENTSTRKTNASDAPGKVKPKISNASGKAKVQRDGKAKRDERVAKAEDGEEAAQRIQKAFHKTNKLPKKDEEATGVEKLPSQARINKETEVSVDDGVVATVARGKSEGSGIA